jgi:diguanylate cyclase (GGDEF)-like protein
VAFQKGQVVVPAQASEDARDSGAAVPLDAAASAAILADTGTAAYHWNLVDDQLRWSAHAAQMLRAASVPASGRAFTQLIDAGPGPGRYDTIARSTLQDRGDGVPYQIEYCFRPSPDSDLRLWVEDSGRWFAGADGRPAYAQGIVRVINERHAREQHLAFLAHCDEMTGEFNRWRLIEVLLRDLNEAKKMRGSCGFLLVSIDNLAWLNEGYGFGIGDEVVGAVAKRLRGLMRGEDSLGRYSGNKFGIVLKQCNPDELAVAAERLLIGVRSELIETSRGPIAVSVSIGGLTAPRHANTAEEVLAHAHDALAAAKAKRLGSFMAYQPNPEREATRRNSRQLTDEIVQALNERRVTLAFEPVVDVGTRQIAFHESLMRVHRPDGSEIPMAQLVPVAERLGLIRLLDHRVFEIAVAELVAYPEIVLSVNVSPASTMDSEWWSGLGALLRTQRAAAERLIVEITETAAIHDVGETRGFVSRVKDLGCRVAIDDFGAGHTSFRNLRALGVDIVKVDGAFVQNIMRSADDRAFVQSLLQLSRRLGLKTVAEWVQDEESAALLASWGCDYLQGELIGRASLQRPWADTVSSGAAGGMPAQPVRAAFR